LGSILPENWGSDACIFALSFYRGAIRAAEEVRVVFTPGSWMGRLRLSME